MTPSEIIHKQEAEIMAALRDAALQYGRQVTAREVAEITDKSLSAIKSNMTEMVRAGLVVIVDMNGFARQHPRVSRYLLTEYGLDQLNDHIAERGEPRYD